MVLLLLLGTEFLFWYFWYFWFSSEWLFWETDWHPSSSNKLLPAFSWFLVLFLGGCTFIISESLEQIHSSVQAAASKQIRQAKLVIYSNAASWIHARETLGVYRKASDNSQYWWRRSARPYSCHHSYWTRRQTTETGWCRTKIGGLLWFDCRYQHRRSHHSYAHHSFHWRPHTSPLHCQRSHQFL